MKRSQRTILYTIGALLVGAGAYYAMDSALTLYAQRQIQGELFNTLSGQRISLGDFLIRWDGHSLNVTHALEPERTLFSTLPDQGFIASAIGEESVTESGNALSITDQRFNTCRDQTMKQVVSNGGYALFKGRLRCAGGGQVPYELAFALKSNNQLGFSIKVQDPRYNRLYLTYASDPDERFYGFGEQFSRFDLKGSRLAVFVRDQGVGRGLEPLTSGANALTQSGGTWDSTSISVPHYLTSKMRSVMLENSEYMVFDLRKKDRVHLQLFSGEMHGQILYGNTPIQLIKAYTQVVGRMRALPDWITRGAVVGMQGGTQKVREVWEKLKALGTPISAFWLQDWVGQRNTRFGKQLWWNWELDEEHYPEFRKLTADLQNAGIRTLGYISPMLADASRKPGVKRNLFREALDHGYFVRNDDGEPYLIQLSDFRAGLIDLTNQEAARWLTEVAEQNLIGSGFSGWMADGGENLPYSSRLYAGGTGKDNHNLYPVMWSIFNRNLVDRQKHPQDYVFMMRSGFTGSPYFSSLFWTGDQLVSWDDRDGIKTAVLALLSSGLSGFSFNHSDIGGYTTVKTPLKSYTRSKELLKRWMELSAFTPVFRTHEGNLPEDNAQFYTDDETLKQFDRMAKVYKAWGFYRTQLIAEAASTGVPVVRPMFLHFPNDPEVLGLSYQQFMVGSQLLVAPVLDPGQEEVEVYLPAGSWVEAWTGESFLHETGEKVRVKAPIGYPAVFYPAGSKVGEIFSRNLRNLGLIPLETLQQHCLHITPACLP
ncbi:alpha-glucosidase [Deinococcus cellulosilyticus]|uniref:Alpha-glucosidase n=1 Tax=Deinococcus cellulosilyticus (strain DSM 18568 / NBRC 106333 / KACC 11606 / 5516J-15) TaxID=1223518 RepID=A0A511N729_DEIC1|nr:alpha-glucosidase [Deinococcus cellulosilyticus]GEM48266.1 alpha-glucosidase [Deinococcus cellulosilyticus NBRC 106333 = KACC 11606]